MHISRACRPRTPAGEIFETHRPCAWTRLRIVADTPMRPYRPVYPLEHTIVVYPGIPADVHMTYPYLVTPILQLL